MFQDFPIKQDIQFVVGNDFSFPFYLYQPTSGYSFDSYVSVPSSGLVAFTVDNNDQVNGQVSVNMGHVLTAEIPPGVYDWQFSFTDLQGRVQTWFQGICTVKANA